MRCLLNPLKDPYLSLPDELLVNMLKETDLITRGFHSIQTWNQGQSDKPCGIPVSPTSACVHLPWFPVLPGLYIIISGRCVGPDVWSRLHWQPPPLPATGWWVAIPGQPNLCLVCILMAHQLLWQNMEAPVSIFQESPLAGEPRDILFHIHSIHRYQLCAKYLYFIASYIWQGAHRVLCNKMSHTRIKT